MRNICVTSMHANAWQNASNALLIHADACNALRCRQIEVPRTAAYAIWHDAVNMHMSAIIANGCIHCCGKHQSMLTHN